MFAFAVWKIFVGGAAFAIGAVVHGFIAAFVATGPVFAPVAQINRERHLNQARSFTASPTGGYTVFGDIVFGITRVAFF